MKTKKIKKTLFTNETLFNKILGILKEKNLLPDILDYSLAESYHVKEIKSYEWDTIGIVNFGGSEGIYLDVYAQGETGNGEEKVRLGTFKTLERSREAFYVMAKLQTDFVYETYDFVSDNMEDFEWTGYNINLYRDGKRICGYSTAGKEGLKRILERHSDFEYAEITDNATCKETTLTKEEIALD